MCHAGPFACAECVDQLTDCRLQLRVDLLPAVVDLRRLFAGPRKYICSRCWRSCCSRARAELLLLRLERDAVGRLPRVDPKDVDALALADRDADRAHRQARTRRRAPRRRCRSADAAPRGRPSRSSAPSASAPPPLPRASWPAPPWRAAFACGISALDCTIARDARAHVAPSPPRTSCHPAQIESSRAR